MKKIWYNIVKFYLNIGLFFFFKNISVKGKNKLPKKGAILLVSNHKNALIDPLLMAISNQRDIYYLTRASAFKIRLVKWLLSTVNMLPIYRMRDGKQTLAKNEAIFNKCFRILYRKKILLIFAEGTHDIKRRVRPLSKGFTRIAFGVFEKYPDLQLNIVPVGLNYTDASLFGESVSIYYGKPILANTYYDKDDINASSIKLKELVSDQLKTLTSHIDHEHYEQIVATFKNKEFLNPQKINAAFNDPARLSLEKTESTKQVMAWRILKILVIINSLIPLLIYKGIEPKIKEVEFVGTTKYALGITAFPLFYLIQISIIGYFFGNILAFIYLIVTVLSVLILAKTKAS